MLKLLFFAALAYIVFRILQKARFSGNRRYGNQEPGPVDEMVQDPNCLTYIPKGNAIRKNIGGETFFFCSRTCVDEFRQKRN